MCCRGAHALARTFVAQLASRGGTCSSEAYMQLDVVYVWCPPQYCSPRRGGGGGTARVRTC